MSFSLFNLITQKSDLAFTLDKNDAGMINIPITCNAVATGNTACYNTKTLSHLIFNPNDILVFMTVNMNSYTGTGGSTIALGPSLTDGGAYTSFFLSTSPLGLATPFSNINSYTIFTNTTGLYLTFNLSAAVTSLNASIMLMVWRQSLI
jgi:hypothetical protein